MPKTKMKWREIKEDEHEVFYHWLRQHKLANCHYRYNGNGEDVLHEAYLIATQRGYFFDPLIQEAARNLKIHEIQADQAGNYCIQTPRSEKTQIRAAEFFNAQDTLETELNSIDERIGLTPNRKNALLNQIRQLKEKGLDDQKIIETMKPITLMKQLPLFVIDFVIEEVENER